jgi:hypothetical protein
VQQKTNGYIRTDNLEIPLSLLYHTNPKSGNRFFAGGGPYVGVALGGIISFDRDIVAVNSGTNTTSSVSALYPIGVGSDAGDDFKRLDAGLQVQTGYELANGFFTRAHAAYGFTDIDPTQDKAHNFGFGLTVGYMIR